jgi:hypothetical protein
MNNAEAASISLTRLCSARPKLLPLSCFTVRNDFVSNRGQSVRPFSRWKSGVSHLDVKIWQMPKNNCGPARFGCESSSPFFVCSTLLQAVRPWTPLAGGESLAFWVRSCDFDCNSACFANNIPRSLRYTVVACMVHRHVDLLSTTPAPISMRRNTLGAGRSLTCTKTS